VNEVTNNVLWEVAAERERQDQKWGPGRIRPIETWNLVLGEEVGEVAKALLENEGPAAVRKELIQVAAVAVEIVEAIDEGRTMK
jgi:NTP pyrophosphatase (non-canonical NTP hydrolase)